MKGRIIGVIIGFFFLLFNVIGAIIGYFIGNELDKEDSQKQQNKTAESLKSKSKVDDRIQTNNKKERKMQLTISKVLKDVNKSIKNLSDGLVYQAERFKIASEEALKQTIEESMRSEAELKESDAAQAISTLAAAKRAKLAALEELAEVEAQAQAKGIDLTTDPFASFRTDTSKLSKYTKTAGTIADKVTESTEKTANIASLISDGIEAQAKDIDLTTDPFADFRD